MENNYFDKKIKDALDKIGEDIPMGDWSLMERAMMADPDFGGLTSEENLFDQQIKNKIDNLEVTMNPTHWEAMESRIDTEVNTPELDDVYVDGVVYENLSNLHIPFNHAHWTLMSNRLDEEFSIRRKLVKYKVAEVALMLLIIITLFQLLPLKKDKHPIANQPSEVLEQPATTKQTNNLLNTNQLAGISSSKLEEEKNDHTTPVISETVTSNQKLVTTSTSSVPETVKKEVSQLASASNVQNIHAVSFSGNTNNEQGNASRLPVKNAGLIFGKNDLGFNVNPVSILQERSAVNPTNLIETLTSLRIDQLDYENPSRNITPPCSDCVNRTAKFKMGMMFSADVNTVFTPENRRKGVEQFVQYRSGYGGGFTFGFQHRRLEVETGLSYSRVSYVPNRKLVVTETENVFLNQEELEFQREDFNRVDLNILRIPINFLYKFDNSGKWQFYALGGASLNMLALNHFNVKITDVGLPSPAVPGRAVNREPTIIDPTSYDGLFEGGNFHDNHFYTANVGMGVERYITPRWSLFMQPVYQRKLFKKGIGPDSDRLHSLSIQFGAKSFFK